MDISKRSEQNITAAINYEALRQVTQKESGLILSLLEQLAARFSLCDPLVIHLEDYQEVFDIPSSSLIDSFLSVKKGFLALKTNEYVISCADPLYPAALAESLNNPPFLYLKGDVSLLDRQLIYVTGTRFLTNEGLKRTKDLVGALCEDKRTVVTGLDRGVESMASLSVSALKGKIVVILSTPLNQFRYEEIRSLQDHIGDHGLLISPFAPSQETQRWHIAVQKEILTTVSECMIVTEEKDGGAGVKGIHTMNESGKAVYIYEDSVNDRSLLWARNLDRLKNVKIVRDSRDVLSFLKTADSSETIRKTILKSEQLSLFD